MEKQKLKSLFLNKKVISNLNSLSITGGTWGVTEGQTCPGCGGTASQDCQTLDDGCIPNTQQQRCGAETADLSWCQGNGGYLPDPCLSNGVCA